MTRAALCFPPIYRPTHHHEGNAAAGDTSSVMQMAPIGIRAQQICTAVGIVGPPLTTLPELTRPQIFARPSSPQSAEILMGIRKLGSVFRHQIGEQTPSQPPAADRRLPTTHFAILYADGHIMTFAPQESETQGKEEANLFDHSRGPHQP